MRRVHGYCILFLFLALLITAGCRIQVSQESPGHGSNSFVAGTMVATPGGRVAIESINVGDLVRSFDPVSGQWSDQPVLAVHAREAQEEIVTVAAGNVRIEGAASHVLFLGPVTFCSWIL